MKVIKWILALIAAALVGLAGFFYYMGLFSSYPVTEETVGPFTYVYESFVGPYSGTGPVFDRVYKTAEKEGIQVTSKGIGIYYDDPGEVASDKLRSDCGVVVREEDAETLSKKSLPLKIGHLAAGPALVVRFPIRNTLSYMLGPQKGYPALLKAAREKGFEGLIPFELYDMDAKTIQFVMPIRKKRVP